jgi:hypothetical protein
MKTSAIVLAGLAAAATLGFSTTGCKTTYYSSRGGVVEPGSEALCRATCDRMIEDRTIPSSALKACQSTCQPRRSARRPKTGAGPASDNACRSSDEGCAEDVCGSRSNASCQCKNGAGCAQGRCQDDAPAPPPAAAPPPPECQVDWDCPEGISCVAGECK